jgi:hypothetical protein
VALVRGIEALLANQSRPESGPRQPADVQGKVEQCHFCGSAVHLDDECEEAVKYILAGVADDSLLCQAKKVETKRKGRLVKI